MGTEHLGRILKREVVAARTKHEDFIAEIDRAFGNNYFFGDQKPDELRTARTDEYGSVSEPDRQGINKLPWASNVLDPPYIDVEEGQQQGARKTSARSGVAKFEATFRTKSPIDARGFSQEYGEFGHEVTIGGDKGDLVEVSAEPDRGTADEFYLAGVLVGPRLSEYLKDDPSPGWGYDTEDEAASALVQEILSESLESLYGKYWAGLDVTKVTILPGAERGTPKTSARRPKPQSRFSYDEPAAPPDLGRTIAEVGGPDDNPLDAIRQFAENFWEDQESREVDPASLQGNAFGPNGLNFSFFDGNQTYKLKFDQKRGVFAVYGNSGGAVKTSRAVRLATEMFKTAAPKPKGPAPTFPDAPPELAQVFREWKSIKDKFAVLKAQYEQMEAQEKGAREQLGGVFLRLNMKTAKVDDLLVEYKESTRLNYPYSKMWTEALNKVNEQTRKLLEKMADDMAGMSSIRTVKTVPIPKDVEEDQGPIGPEYVAAARRPGRKVVTAGLWSRLKAWAHRLLGNLDRTIQVLERALDDTKGGDRVEGSFRDQDWLIGDQCCMSDPYKEGRLVNIVPDATEISKVAWLVHWDNGQIATIPLDVMTHMTKDGSIMKTSGYQDWLEEMLGQGG